ncbi:MAG TPA: hypothetical protein VMD05_02110, partial [Candidatus Nanoarchaeia archaeon]|nr:hypothetical protein [Candidatus Nanoarchaeia archaeon]
VLAKSFSRIHKSNLINFGIVPLEFSNPADYERITLGSKIEVSDVTSVLKGQSECLTLKIDELPVEFELTLTRRLRDVLLAGGLLNYTRSNNPNTPKTASVDQRDGEST